MKSLIGFIGAAASVALISGSVYAFAGSGNGVGQHTNQETLTSTNSSYFLVTLKPDLTSPNIARPEEPDSSPKPKVEVKDYNCQLNPRAIRHEEPSKSEPANMNPQTVEDCQLIKVNFSDKHTPIYWDELQKMKNGAAITEYGEFKKSDRTGYNNADEWYILQTNNTNKSIFSSEKYWNDWSINHNNEKFNLFIHGAINDGGFVGLSQYVITKLTKIEPSVNSGASKFPCYFEGEDITTTKNNCEVFETNSNNGIQNIQFKDINFPDFTKGARLHTLKEGNFYLIDMSDATLKPVGTNLYVLDNSDTEPNKRLATFTLQSIFLGNTSNSNKPGEIIILQQNKNNN